MAIIGVKVNEETNFMPATWNVGLSYDPLLYGVSVGTTRHMHKLLQKAESFTISFVDIKHVSIIRSIGRSTGNEINKVKEFNLDISWSQNVDAPILDIAYCTFECKKRDQILIGDHTLFVGEIVLIQIDKDAIGDYNTLNTEKISPIVYLGIDNYITLDNNSRISLKELPFHYKADKIK